MDERSVVEEQGLRCLMVKEAVGDTEVLPPGLEENLSIQMIDAMNVEIEDTMQEIVHDIREVEDTGMYFVVHFHLSILTNILFYFFFVCFIFVHPDI